ncbi:MAG: LacI family transcriptional regulator [Epulopiscium sp.]|nr:LacI family transcriptional regulator [Candidatus Epulonipiscium sp.]
MTLDEIARELGYSKSTVSRALSGKGRISKETTEIIRNFVNNQENEQKEIKDCTHNIGVVLPADIYFGGGDFFHNCLFGICEAASMFGYNVLITIRKQHSISELQTLVENQRVDGIIITRGLEEDVALKYLTDIKFPTALTGTCDYDEVIQVDTDNEGAAERLITMLIGRGFTKFAFLAKDMHFIADKKRYDGFCKALLKNGIQQQNQLFSVDSAKLEFLDSIVTNLIAEKIQCVICGDDEICTMIMSKLQSEGYRIPKDIAVASLYNSSNLECFSPAVTAINVPAAQMGNMACKQLILKLMNKEYRSRTTVDYDILFRKSTNLDSKY